MSDHIFKLIHSLNRKEKAHFTKYAGMSKSDSKSLQLCQAINKMEAYEEGKLRKKFRQSFDSLKSDLQGKLLEALADFHKADSEHSSVYHALVVLPVLLEKKLTHHFEQHLKKAKKQAENAENWSALYELLDWEKKYLRKSADNKGLAEKFEHIYQRQKHCIAVLQQETYWQNIYFQLNLILKHDHRLLKEDNEKRFKAIGNTPEIEEEGLASLKAKFYYHRSRNVYLRCTESPEKSLFHAERLPVILEGKDDTKYVDALCSLSRAYSANEQFEKQGEVINRLRQLPQYQSENDILVFEKICQISMRYYLNTMQFEAAAELSDIFDNRWEEVTQDLQPYAQMSYCYNFIITHWLLEDYSKALFWIARILEYKFTAEGKNYLMGARILELVIYYDYKPAALENRLDSVRHVLSKHWELTDYEKDIFSFFHQFIKKPHREHLAIFQNFQTSLEQYAKKRLIASNEMLYWCRAKISGKTVRKVIEENN